MSKKKNIVLTGALGQDGLILSKILLKNGYNVVGIVKNINFRNLKGVIYKKINLLDYKELSVFLDNVKPFGLIHLGTKNPNYFELKKKKDFYINNIKATKNLINYFSSNINKNKKLILIGSSQMYGSNKKRVNLKSKFNPINSYAKFRVEAYNYMLKKKKKFQSNMVTAILFNHDSKHRKHKFLIPRLTKLIKTNKYRKLNEIYLENISGDFSHAEDICLGLYKLMISKKNLNKLIFSSNTKTYINDIINYLIKLNKSCLNFNVIPKKNSYTPVGDNSITKKVLKWKIKKNIFKAAQEINSLKR